MPPASASPPSAAPELRRQLLFLVLGVLALDVAMLLLKRALGVDGWPLRRQQAFTVAWVALTLAVVGMFLGRIRTARVRARRARAAGR